MKFKIIRTSNPNEKPCAEAFADFYTPIDTRNVPDPSMLNSPIEEWYKYGMNHRSDGRTILRDMPEEKCWSIKLNDLKDLRMLASVYGPLIISIDENVILAPFPSMGRGK